MVEMSENTRLTLIDTMSAALKSRDKSKMEAAQHLLRTKCHQSNISWAVFLVDEVLPASKRYIPIMKAEKEHNLDCPYCERDFRNGTGLKAHLGRKHPDRKAEWSIKI